MVEVKRIENPEQHAVYAHGKLVGILMRRKDDAKFVCYGVAGATEYWTAQDLKDAAEALEKMNG